MTAQRRDPGFWLPIAAVAVLAAGGAWYLNAHDPQPLVIKADQPPVTCLGGLSANDTPACHVEADTMTWAWPGSPIEQGGSCTLHTVDSCMAAWKGPHWQADMVDDGNETAALTWTAASVGGAAAIGFGGAALFGYLQDLRTRRTAADPATVPSLPVLQEV